MSEEAAQARRQQFIDDIVEVCKKHRVMIEFPEDGEWMDTDEVGFAEETQCKSGIGFFVDIGELEDEVRLAVWPVIHPEANRE